MNSESIKARVLEKYADVARRLREPGKGSCGGPGPAAEASCDSISGNLYRPAELEGLPEEAARASLGSGNPVALAELKPGEVVLDLGSGGGIDVLLAARQVGPAGKAYGLDMTDEMLGLARQNQARAGVENAEFLKGEIEAIPLPDASVDVVISNCVINLSADKPQAFAEAFRVLKPGGRLAVSDVVFKGPVPELVRRSMEAWTGCLAGALEEDEYQRLLAEAGFEAIEVKPTRIYRVSDARQVVQQFPSLSEDIERQGLRLDDVAAEADGKYRSASIRAIKPRGGEFPG